MEFDFYVDSAFINAGIFLIGIFFDSTLGKYSIK